MEEGAPLLGPDSKPGAGQAPRRAFGPSRLKQAGSGRAVKEVEAVDATEPVVRGVRGKRREREKRGLGRIPGPGPTGAVKIRNVPKKPCPVCAAWTSADPTDRTKGKLVPNDGQEPRRSSLPSSRLPVLASGTSKADPEPGAAAAPAKSKGF